MTLSIAGTLANPSKIRSEVLSSTHAELISSASTPADQVKSYPHIFSVSERGAQAVAIPIIGSEATSRMGEVNPLQMMGRSEKRGLVTPKSTGKSKVNALSSGFLPTYHAEWASYKNVPGEVKDRLQISRPSSTIDLRAIGMRGTIPRDQRRGQTVSQAEPGVSLTNSKPASSLSGQGTPSMPGVSHTREPGSIVAPLFVDRSGKRGANTYGETSSDTGSGHVGVSDTNRATSPIRGSNFKGSGKQSDASPKAMRGAYGVGSEQVANPQHDQQAIQGDVFLDGALVGRWISRFLSKETGRPSSGPTGFDSRRNALLPGVTVGR